MLCVCLFSHLYCTLLQNLTPPYLCFLCFAWFQVVNEWEGSQLPRVVRCYMFCFVFCLLCIVYLWELGCLRLFSYLDVNICDLLLWVPCPFVYEKLISPKFVLLMFLVLINSEMLCTFFCHILSYIDISYSIWSSIRYLRLWVV